MMMYLVSLLGVVILVTLPTCQSTTTSQSIDLNKPAKISATAKTDLQPGKCHMTLGDGPLFSVRYHRSFVYPDPDYKCLQFICNKVGEIKLRYYSSGCSFNNTCLKFGQTVIDDQCQAWKCAIDYRAWLKDRVLHFGVFIDRMKTKCMLDGKCRERGELVYDDDECIQKRCTVYGRPFGRWSLGHLQYWRPHVADCKVSGQCFKTGARFEIGCVTYKCNNEIVRTPKVFPNGTIFKSYNITGGISFVNRKCKRFNTNECIEQDKVTKFGTCIEYTCSANGTNVLTKEGCPNALTKQCGDIGDIISPIACVKLQCTKVGNKYSYTITSEGCYNGDTCTDVGAYGRDRMSLCTQLCQKKVLSGMMSYQFTGDCVVPPRVVPSLDTKKSNDVF